MIFLWDSTLLQIVLGHSGNSSPQYGIECFDYSECNALKASENEWNEKEEVPKPFRHTWIWSIQDPLRCLEIVSAHLFPLEITHSLNLGAFANVFLDIWYNLYSSAYRWLALGTLNRKIYH